MKVVARFHGILSGWLGTSSASFDLPPNAAYIDLLAEIRYCFGSHMPEQLWDSEKNTFKEQVVAQR